MYTPIGARSGLAAALHNHGERHEAAALPASSSAPFIAAMGVRKRSVPA